MVDVVVLNYNDSDTTIAFIKSIREYANVSHIVVVDNASTDNSVTQLRAWEGDKVDLVCNGRNGGYGAGNNVGIRYLYETYGSQYILLANPDVQIAEDVIATLETFLSTHPDYAIAAPLMCDAKGVPQRNTAFPIPSKMQYIRSFGMVYSKFSKTQFYSNIQQDTVPFRQVGAVSGSLFLMDAEKMLRHGMYDENIFLYCEEITLGLKLREAGCKTALLPGVRFIHNHSVSISKSFRTEYKRHRLLVKSKLYVIRHYYGANAAEYAFARIMAGISLAETYLNSCIRKR